MRWPRFTARTIQARLTVWHTGVLTVLLLLFGTAAYSYVARSNHRRADRMLRDAADAFQRELVEERSHQSSDRRAVDVVLQELRFSGYRFLVYDAEGTVIAGQVIDSTASGPVDKTGSSLDPSRLGAVIRAHPVRDAVIVTLSDDEGGSRAVLAPAQMAKSRYVIAVVASNHEEAEALEDARTAMLVALPIGVLLSALGGWLLAKRSLAPMVAMRKQTAYLSARNLGERLPVAIPGDEVGQLAMVINELLARLQRAFAMQQQFMADASHELRTPVAVVQNEASLALSRPERASGEYVEALRVIREAGRRLRRIVDDLFLLARADAGDIPLHQVPLYLDEIIAECRRAIRSFAAARGATVTCHVQAEAPYVGDEALLARLLLNLLDNAIKHSPPGARVHVRLEGAASTGYRVTVSDNGPGIPTDAQAHIFDRFVRTDAARASDAHSSTSGAGLGLAIARWIAEAHGGTLSLARSGVGGSVFVLELPPR